MSCTSDLPSCSFRELGIRAAHKRSRGLAAVAFATLALGACTGMVGPGDDPNAGGPPAPGQKGTGGTPGAPAQPGTGGTPGAPAQPGTGGTPGAPAQPGTGGSTANLSKGGVMLRLLTQTEYVASIQALLGTFNAPLTPPGDTSVSGFISVGASQMSVTDTAATAYESASLAVTAEVFADTARWQRLVGCAPKADLSDACVSTYIKTFGRRAFRRDLTNDEATHWLGVAKNAAMISGTAAQGLAAATAGLIQSPNFLYRFEKNAVDPSNGRLKYDGLSMATRIAYLLTGGPPTVALLDAAAAGQLDTAEGVRTAAAPLLTNTAAVAERMTSFLAESFQLQQLALADKSTTLFPNFTPAMKNSMLQSARMFLKNIVLAPNADVRSVFDSNMTFVDANLAPIYGVQAPASGFMMVQLPANSGRAGIMGQAAVLSAQSQTNRTSPTRRGVFILENILCTHAPAPPPDVNTNVPIDPSLTTREQLAQHRANPTCATCHTFFDPLGLALEHFDPIGKYRETENGMPIDATGELGGMPFDGAAQMGAVLKKDPRTLACMLRHLYRDANGRAEDDRDLPQINALTEALAARGYVWNNFLADFVASEAFRSAPALPVTTGS